MGKLGVRGFGEEGGEGMFIDRPTYLLLATSRAGLLGPSWLSVCLLHCGEAIGTDSLGQDSTAQGKARQGNGRTSRAEKRNVKRNVVCI